MTCIRIDVIFTCLQSSEAVILEVPVDNLGNVANLADNETPEAQRRRFEVCDVDSWKVSVKSYADFLIPASLTKVFAD